MGKLRTQTVVEARNLEITEAIREYTENKVEKIHKHYDSIIKNHDVIVMLSVPKNHKGKVEHKAEITINLDGGHLIKCHTTEANVYAAVDTVVDKIDTQLRRYKSKLTDKHREEKALITATELDHFPADFVSQFSTETQSAEEIKAKHIKMEALDPEDAAKRLEDCSNPFFMFLNVYSNKIACVYKRADGHVGLMEPEFLQVAS